jgi:hypothetical protein
MDFTNLIVILSDEDIIYYSLLSPQELASVLARPKPQITNHNNVQTTVALGQSGENKVLDLINYSTEVVSSSSFNMDLRVKTRVGIILVEVKNYNNIVPSKEYSKFLRDVSLNQHIVGALFISLNTEIAGRRGIIQFDNMWNDGPIIVSIVTNNSDDINGVISLIEDYIESRHNSDIDRERIVAIIHNIAEYNNNLLVATKTIHDCKDLIIKSLDSAAQIVYSTEMNIRRLLRESNNIIYDMIQPIHSEILTIDTIFTHSVINQGILSTTIFQEFLIMMIRYISTSEMLIVSFDKSSATFLDTITCKIKPLKTKLIFMIEVKTDINIPRCASYKDDWVSFEITKKNMMRDSIMKFVDSLRSCVE